MKKIIMLSISTLLSSFLTLSAQRSEIKRTTHWYFGAGAGLDFSSGSPVPDTTGHLFAYEGCSTMSDTAGNLLFYTNGDTVWNKNHQPMPNGTGLDGCKVSSSANAGLIVPKPESNTLFYVFTTDCKAILGDSGFRYSVIDMSLNGGLGDVTVKNYLLFRPSQEGCAATKACNGKDFWVTAHEYGTNGFKTYKIDSNGVDSIPIISNIGYIYTYSYCFLRFSPDGSKLATANSNPGIDELFDFDNTNGSLYSYINLIGLFGGAYSPLFSPDNSKLYYEGGGDYVYQYNLSTGSDSATISASRYIVANNPDNNAYGSLENGPDGKVYVSSLFEDSISTIEYPNGYGASCNFMNHNIYLGGKKSELALPLFVQNYFWDTIICKSSSSEGMTKITEEDVVQVYPIPANNLIYIKVIATVAKNYTIEIYNGLGVLYLKQKCNNSEMRINTTFFPSGLYLLKINLTISSQTIKKIIINH